MNYEACIEAMLLGISAYGFCWWLCYAISGIFHVFSHSIDT